MAPFTVGDTVEHTLHGVGVIEYERPPEGNAGRRSYFVQFRGAQYARQVDVEHLRLLRAQPTTPGRQNTQRLHPLHTPALLNQMVLSSGCYADVSRCTGRSTALALRLIAEAIENPGKAVPLRDHHNTTPAHDHFCRLVHAMTGMLRLQHMHVHSEQRVLVFENRDPR